MRGSHPAEPRVQTASATVTLVTPVVEAVATAQWATAHARRTGSSAGPRPEASTTTDPAAAGSGATGRGPRSRASRSCTTSRAAAVEGTSVRSTASGARKAHHNDAGEWPARAEAQARERVSCWAYASGNPERWTA
ncbi:hypothetical protein JAV76_09210 [Sanguibacter sp. YZGR15]|uniref:Uncharacterized protein n=1 Tax=Sanguibacter suaedae TaxID=2795737 RepID=A0A934ICC9_9MICO|nr:hypothetical protein [Sanguibacter suaedae]MBI9115185.1 hypothetical protein [Sanguibacter suaedae]